MAKKELTPVELLDKARANLHVLGGLSVVAAVVLMLTKLVSIGSGAILLLLAAFVYTLGDVLRSVTESQKAKKQEDA